MTYVRVKQSLEYVYMPCVEVDIPNNVKFETNYLDPYVSVIRTFYIDEYVSAGQFTLDNHLVSSLEKSGIYNPDMTALALDLRDTKIHAVVSAYLNTDFRAEYHTNLPVSAPLQIAMYLRSYMQVQMRGSVT